MTDHKYTYKVIEDNGGGLHLFVFRGRQAVYHHAGYEYNRGQLIQDLDALDSGADVGDFDGCEESPQGNYGELTSHEYGWKLVASNSGSERKLYRANMGRAAQLEFGVSDDDVYRAQAAAAMGTARGEKKSTASRENGKRGGRPRKDK